MDLLATPADLAAVSVGQVSVDAAMEMLGRTSAIVRGYCGWAISQQQYDLTLDGTGSAVIALPAMKVSQVTSVSEHGAELLADVDYEWSESGIVERLGRHWTRRRRAIHATFAAGYEEVPRDIVAVVTGLASRVLSTPGGWTSQRIGSLQLGQSLTSGAGLDRYEQAILDRYRIP